MGDLPTGQDPIGPRNKQYKEGLGSANSASHRSDTRLGLTQCHKTPNPSGPQVQDLQGWLPN